MDKVRRFSEMILQKHPGLFTQDFEKNKEVLAKVAIIRTKYLRNQVAGYITRLNSPEEPEKAETEAPAEQANAR